ncbi:MAG: hypothetical protein COA57_11525 [Flavobacteriales bacterium]|nr:MAG: hypothetical protein COA57_11525 [Flavobacteriales bacterium]
MNILVKICLFILLFLLSEIGYAQNGRQLVQFSGVVISGDSLSPVPFANIIIKNTRRGTMSDFYGFFSFVAQLSDTVEFSSVGYKKSAFIIPDSLTTNRYSLIQMMTKDTILLKETVIYPWPTKEQFREAFLNLRIPDDDYERARKNLARAELKERLEVTAMDGSENYKYQMQQYQSRLYYAGQYPPNNLLNPIAWAQFIKAWKEGKFKRRKD